MNTHHTIQKWALSKDYLHNRMSFICGPLQIGKTINIPNGKICLKDIMTN
jgi:hypothetical protein